MAEIDRQLRASDSFVVLLSEDSIRSDMVRQEVKIAHELRQDGKLAIFPVRLNFRGTLPYDLGSALDRIQYALWHPGDPEAKLFALLHTAITGGASFPVAPSSEDPAVLSIGPFGDHLRRHLWALLKNDRLRAVVARIARGEGCDDEGLFQRLLASGLVTGEGHSTARLRCALYQTSFSQRL